jgi:hypothetical protein
MLRLIIGLSLAAVTLSGCATARKTYTSTGKEGYSINCSGTSSTWGRCYERAGDLCGSRGYEVLEKIGESISSSSGTILEQHSGTDINRNMIIKCKD